MTTPAPALLALHARAGDSGCFHDSDCACSDRVIARDARIRSALPLRFSVAPGGGQRSAYDRGTGYGYVVTRVEGKGPRGGRTFEYEVEIGAAGRRVHLHYVHRLDTAVALANGDLADRLSGASL